MKSPCNQICEIDHSTGYCTGCGRTLGEIEEWSIATDGRKGEILSELPQRMTALSRK
jgi:hypothetical protein